MIGTLAVAAFLAVSAPAEDSALVLSGGTIVDVSDGESAGVRDAVVVVRGGQIVAAGPRKTTKIPAHSRIVRIVGEVFRWPKVGRVEKGCDADLLVVDADPTADIRNLEKIRMVILNGEIVDRAGLLVLGTRK